MPRPRSRSRPTSSGARTSTAHRIHRWRACRRPRSRCPRSCCPPTRNPGSSPAWGPGRWSQRPCARVQLLAGSSCSARPSPKRWMKRRMGIASCRSCGIRMTCWGKAPALKRIAQHYLESYRSAIAAISKDGDGGPFAGRQRRHLDQAERPASAATRTRSARVSWPNWCRASGACASRPPAPNINLTIDAEEVDRLELSLDVFEALAQRVAQEQPQWRGFGLALQSYQSRALELIAHVAALGRKLDLHFMCPGWSRAPTGTRRSSGPRRWACRTIPVFTHKHHPTSSYLACARALFDAGDVIFPQFADAQRRDDRRDPADGAAQRQRGRRRSALRAAAPPWHG